MPVTPVDLFRSVGLRVDGPARWGAPIRAPGPGVYLVEWPEALDRAPTDISAIGTWIARVPTLTLDGTRPTGKALAARLAAFWLRRETIMYVGMTAGSISDRLADLVRTPLGDDRPHAGGHWLKALVGHERCRTWWAETNAPEEYEDALLEAFGTAVPPESRALLPAGTGVPAGTEVVPFANLAGAGGEHVHGIAGALAEPAASTAPPAAEPASGRRSAAQLTEADVARVNDALQRLACGEPGLQITPSQANAEASIRLLLREDPSRAPSALGQLLRAGRIEGAHQDLDGRWAIRCTRRG